MCNFNITESMSHDHPISSVPAIANIMQHIRVLMYNGALDLSCNHLGATHALEMTTWNGQPWTDANRGLMVHNQDVFGQYYALQNLSFLVIRDAGHFVPTDQPSGALDMIERFLTNGSFVDVELPKDKAYASMLLESAGSGDETALRVSGGALTARGVSDSSPTSSSSDKSTFMSSGLGALVLFFACMSFYLVYRSQQKETFR